MSTTQIAPLPSQVTARTRRQAFGLMLALTLGLVLLFASFGSRAYAATPAVDLGTAETYSVLGGQSVTNTGPSTLDGDVGVSPGTSITGFPPGLTGGTEHRADEEAEQAQSDLTIAYDDAAGRAPLTGNYSLLGGRTLVAGVYKATSTMRLTGTVTLDGQGRNDGVWIFQVGSALGMSTSSTVNLTNGANACNVFWQVGESATIGTGSKFVGTVMALTSITVDTGATVQGRALARNGSVTLDNNVFTGSACNLATPTPTATVTATSTATATVTATATATETTTVTASPTVIASESATEGTELPTVIDSQSATDSQGGTASTNGGGNGNGGSGGGNLARTGSSSLMSVFAIGGLALLAVGGALLITGRLRPRRPGRHQG